MKPSCIEHDGYIEYDGTIAGLKEATALADKLRRDRMRVFEGGATRDSGEGKLQFEGFLSPAVLREYARFMHTHRKQADGKLRAPDNWQVGTGIPKEVYADSLIRHVMAFWLLHRGEEVEQEMIGGELRQPTMMECLCGILFNAMGFMWQLLREQKLKEVS